LVALLIASLIVASALGQAPAGEATGKGTSEVQGVVRNPLGYGAPGVTVWLRSRPAQGEAAVEVQNRWVKTGLKGEFQFPGVREGRYVLCAELPRSEFLSTCLWEEPQPFIVAPASADRKLHTIELKRGKLMRLVVPMPVGAKSVADRKAISESVAFEVQSASGLPITARLQHVAEHELQYAVLVPAEAAVRVTGTSKSQRFSERVPGVQGERKSLVSTVVAGRSSKPFELVVALEGVEAEVPLPNGQPMPAGGTSSRRQ
jgi:hypothetical protein